MGGLASRLPRSRPSRVGRCSSGHDVEASCSAGIGMPARLLQAAHRGRPLLPEPGWTVTAPQGTKESWSPGKSMDLVLVITSCGRHEFSPSVFTLSLRVDSGVARLPGLPHQCHNQVGFIDLRCGARLDEEDTAEGASGMSNEQRKRLGSRIAELRKIHGTTQRALSMRANVSYSLLCKVESGERLASHTFIAAIARALSVNVTDITEQPYGPRNASPPPSRPEFPLCGKHSSKATPELSPPPAALMTCAQLSPRSRSGIAGPKHAEAVRALPDMLRHLTSCQPRPADRAVSPDPRTARGRVLPRRDRLVPAGTPRLVPPGRRTRPDRCSTW